MNKEELIKIFSAYLPYKLKLGFDGDDYEHLLVGVDLCNEGLQLISPFGDFGRCEIDKPKPVLYDLSYLTKEIEHEGRLINLYDEIVKRYPNTPGFRQYVKEGLYTLYGIMDSKVEYVCVLKLLEYHINVFGLKENEFINKATLNKG